MKVPQRLAAPAPRWCRDADVIVVGSGIAGMTVALTASKAARVVLVTKGSLDAGSTSWAQGGIAAAIGIADTADEHVADTISAGAGLCNPRAVRVLVEEGPRELARLVSIGARLDTDANGALALGREGGHGRARIVHAGGDSTGAEVQRCLMEALAADPNIEVIENAFLLDVLLSEAASGRCAAAGVRIAVQDEEGHETVGEIAAAVTVLASGGLGQLYSTTTNPAVATGDGMAAALRAGARLADLEFVQFHPTVFWNGRGAHGQQLLISEAMRGEGAVIIDAAGRRVMTGVHPLEDLAPRDVVAKAMAICMAEGRGDERDHLFLDATGLGAATLLRRFPTIVERCRTAGVDPATSPIPVAPGAHFSCGGVWTDRTGGTDVPGLFAVGETACTGVHGANRLASNSLLEGLVFGARVGAQVVLQGSRRSRVPVEPDHRPAALVQATERDLVTSTMTRYAAVRRDAYGLHIAAKTLREIPATPADSAARADWEATNLLTLACVVVGAADEREESRGCHWREDHTASSDEWRVRIVTSMRDSVLHRTHEPLADRS